MLEQRGATGADFDTFLRERLLIDKYKAKLAKDITIDEQSLRAYYDGHRELFTEPKRAQIEITSVPSPAASSMLLGSRKAERKTEALSGYHDDKGVVSENTQRQWVSIEVLPTTLRTPLEAAKVGDVFELPEGNGQIRVIEVIAVEEAHALSFDDVRNRVRSTLLQRRQESLLDDWYTQASQHASIEYPPPP
jgi:peptidyl-prolyl cis-trans isomerase D